MLRNSTFPIKKGSDHLRLFSNCYDRAGPIGTNWAIGQTSFNPHCISASFSNLPLSEPRPHINIEIFNLKYTCLIDSGAAVSLISAKAAKELVALGMVTVEDSHVYIKDCHSHVQTTKGALTVPFNITSHDIKGARAHLHITENLSSDILLGCDSLANLGCIIDFDNKEVTFNPREAKAIKNSQHPLFLEAVASSQATNINNEINNYINKYTFAASPTEEVIINPGDQIKFKVNIETDANLQLTPGAMVLIQSDGANLNEPRSVLETTFVTVENNNKLSISMANISCSETILPKNDPIPGLTIQSMAAFHTPVQVTQDDLIMMANIRDTFAEASAISPTFAHEYEVAAAAHGIHPHKPTQEQGINDEDLFTFTKKVYTQAVSVLRKTDKPSLGKTTPPSQPCPEGTTNIILSQLDLSGADEDWREAYKDLVLKNWDIFSLDRFDLGHAAHYEHHIEPIEPGLDPPFTKQFPIPVNDEPLLDEMAKTLTQRGVLIPMNSPGNSPVFIVRKPGSQARFVEDLRNVNYLTKIDKYQILGLRESIIQAGKKKPKYFSSLDMSGAFWQLSLSEESKPWSAFTLPFLGTQFCWNRTPMGAKGSTSSFAKFLHIVFRGMPDMLTFVDDMLTMSQTNEEMLISLQKAFNILRSNNLKLNLKKCKLGRREVDWLGFSLSSEGIRPEQSKVDKCRQLEPPTSAKEIASQLPFMQFNSQCLEEFQLIAGPLTDLTKADSPWKSIKRHGPLPQEALNAWLELKAMILERPVIAFADHALPFQLFCDAAVGTMDKPGGISAVLTQVFDQVTKPIAYFSRRLRASERRYDGFNAELLSVVSALEHWRTLLIGSNVTCFTDQKPIVSQAARARKTCSALIRKILEFDCKFVHIIGKDNLIADYLSRNLLTDDDKEEICEDIITGRDDKASLSLLPYPNTQFNNGIKTAAKNSAVPQNNNIQIQAEKKSAAHQNKNNQTQAEKKSAANQNNNNQTPAEKKSADIIKLSNGKRLGDSVPSSIDRMALVAQEQRNLGMVGSRKRFTAKGIAAAGVTDMASQDLWMKKQAEDEIIMTLITYTLTKIKPTEGSWERALINDMGHRVALENKLLYYYGSYRRSQFTKKLMVPKDLITPIISEAHDSAMGGHWGVETTIRTLMNTYFWPTMAIDVSNHIKKCPSCYITEDKNARKATSHIHPLPTPTRPGQRLHADLVGPLVNSISDHKYVLSMVDALTKWTVLVPLKSKTAEEVAINIVNNWILNISNIETLVTDSGTEFCNQIVQKIAEFMKTTLRSTAAYSPKSNGQCERIHRSLGKFLTIYTNELGDDWMTWLPCLQYSLNTKTHSSTGYSPWFLQYSRHPVFSWRQKLENIRLYGEDEATRRLNLIQYALNMVKTNDKEAKLAFQKAHNKKFKERGFKVGDFCLVHYPSSSMKGRINRKLIPNWKGLFRITDILGKNTYKVKKEGGRSTKVPTDRLKLYNEFLHQDDPDVQLTPEDEPEQEQDEDTQSEEQT